jgi:hypothetical protein
MENIEKRPIAISILGYILIIGGVLFVLKIVIGGSFSFERNLVNLILKSLSIVVGIGYLKMRKWSFYLWIIGFIIGTALLFIWPPSEEVYESYTSIMGIVSLLIVPLIITMITLKYWKIFK